MLVWIIVQCAFNIYADLTNPNLGMYQEPCLMEVENEVKLADIAKVAVQHLHKVMDDLQSDQLIVSCVDAHNKI